MPWNGGLYFPNKGYTYETVVGTPITVQIYWFRCLIFQCKHNTQSYYIKKFVLFRGIFYHNW